MKRLQLNPLALDKETIAKLDEKQLQEITGGISEEADGSSTGCGSGGSKCSTGTSTGCGSGGSQCFVESPVAE
ncbi:class I lanthipeptide [Chitinophaga sp.]|uniref:class I lanthipeptide n=1 Tax=Chitinophaga sp. TaxID=1869181 RepID=UPI0031E38CB3